MKMKTWIITGVSLLCAGAICCGAAVHAGALDQKRYMKMLDLTDYTDTPDGAVSSVLMLRRYSGDRYSSIRSYAAPSGASGR